ncbi:MAG: hypothetical protein VX367_10140, partial [SAR324 cluster bacterium]|nr:hypothetical protein [SAR324 cluster bacterium]
TMNAGKKVIENVVNNQTPERRQPTPRLPPPPPPPTTPSATKTTPTSEAAEQQRPLPLGFQNFENERRKAAEAAAATAAAAAKTPSISASADPPTEVTPTDPPEETKSTKSSTKSSKKGSQRSKTASVMSQQVERERQKKKEAERERLKNNDAQADADIALYQSLIEDIRRQKEIDKTLHEVEIKNIDKNADEQQAVIEAAEEDDRSAASGVVDDGERSRNAGVGLEMTAAGAVFGGETPDALTSAWVNGVTARTTSTAKKDVKTRITPSIPGRSLPDPPRKSRKKLNVDDPEDRKSVKKEEKKPPIMPFHKLSDVKPKKKKLEGVMKNEKEKTKDERLEKAKSATEMTPPQRTTSPSRLSKTSSTSSSASSTTSSNTSSRASSASNNLMANIMKLQQQQLEAALRQSALDQLKEARPTKKFSGNTTKRMDFEKHMKIFNEAMEIPGVSKKQMLNEIQHWFEGSAFKLVEAETLKKTESAVDEVVAKLTKKFGMRQETALEMLDEVLQGKAVDEKDHNGILDLYARLVSVHSLAVETNKADDFKTSWWSRQSWKRSFRS